MIKKKSIFAFALAACLAVPAMFMLTACGNNKNGSDPQEHVHTYSSEWANDETHHWHDATCGDTDEKGEYGIHVYDNDDDRDCNTCGYVRAMANQITFNTFDTRTYNKTAQPLTASEYNVEHEAGEVVVEYKLKNAEDSTYSTDAPVKAGQYTVRVTVKENETYSKTSNTNDFIISPYVLNEVKGHHSKVYDGNANIVKPFEIFEGDRISVQMVMSSKNVGATLYQAVINGPGNSNYQLPADLSGMTAEITAKKLNFNTTNMTKVYDGTANYRYDFTTADGLVAGDECYVSFVAKQIAGSECIDAGEYTQVVSDNEVTASNPNYVIDNAYSNFGDFSEGINTKLTITKRKLNIFKLKVTSTDVPEGSTGAQTINFIIVNNTVARDKEKVVVKVTFDAGALLSENSEQNTPFNLVTVYEDISSEAKIEFKTDGSSDAYKNYEFDTNNLGTISLQK